jgi:hypothetical protein
MKKIIYITFLSVIISTSVPTVYAEQVAVLTFDDNWKGQYLYVRPILEKYGFKATFFVVCNWIGSSIISYFKTLSSLKFLENKYIYRSSEK